MEPTIKELEQRVVLLEKEVKLLHDIVGSQTGLISQVMEIFKEINAIAKTGKKTIKTEDLKINK